MCLHKARNEGRTNIKNWNCTTRKWVVSVDGMVAYLRYQTVMLSGCASKSAGYIRWYWTMVYKHATLCGKNKTNRNVLTIAQKIKI